ncbi:hypothetical protein NT6N_37640 [Oceaniferula spumae]|uniref:Sialate O-acetylesterase domain-containing protein n=1 Tax=Oceaniferula spumae TaxID=2979115 RepID=A0AAT9FRU8_9BACT
MKTLLSALLAVITSSAHAGVWAHYSFDTDFTDSSANARHGSLTDVGTTGNSAITTTAGTYKFGGGAMVFSADRDYIAIPSKTFSSGAPYTIAFWAKRDSASHAYDMVIGERGNTKFFIGLNNNDLLRWRSADENQNPVPDHRQHDFPSTADTDWHHHAIVASGTGSSSVLSYYRDGQHVETVTGKSLGFILDTIGEAYDTSLDLDFAGLIDEVWILDHAADAETIANLHEFNQLTAVDPSVTRVHTILIGGQSNADGRGNPAHLPTSPVNLQQPQDDVDFIYRIRNDTSSTTTTLRPGTSFSNGFGPAIVLGRRLADLYALEPNTRVAIIKYANGGTNLHTQWKGGGDATTAGDGTEYQIFQTTVTDGLAHLAAKYPNATTTLDAMLWVQGESDAKTGHAASYQTNLTNFIADIRLTYGTHLPFIISRLSDQQTDIGSADLDTVQQAQDNVEAADHRTAIINTDTFGMDSDDLHFNAAGQQAIGSAAAEQSSYAIWMTETFTSTQIDNGNAEPGHDVDNDGKSNLEEFLQLSDPLSNTSQSQPWVTLPTPSTPTLNHNSSSLRLYLVQKYDATTMQWGTFSPETRGDGSVRTYNIANPDNRGIYRVISSLP